MIAHASPPKRDLLISPLVGRHLALAPVAFAVTEGADHSVVYANALFRKLQAAGQIHIGSLSDNAPRARGADLTPFLDDAFRSDKTVRDALVAPPAGGIASWSCSIWPVADSSDAPKRLVVEVRDVELIEGAKQRQRAIVERLLLGAFHEQDVARHAEDVSERAQYLAAASRELSMSLDEAATLDTVRHLALPRPGTWCIVDVIESNGALHRLAVIHPDPEKRALARRLEQQCPTNSAPQAATVDALGTTEPTIVTADSGAALVRAARGDENLQILRQIGFGSLLVVPLIVRARVQGAITFVSREGDPPFTAEEISLAGDLAARCALALDNARLYHEADALRLAAEAANETKSQFLGTMSHELRTPLNAIGGFAELLETGIEGPVTEQQRTALGRIRTNSKHLLMLIEEILNFVRIESGRMEYRLGPVSMANAIGDVVGMIGGMAREKGLTLTSPPCDVGIVAWADPDRVRQILVNLIMNAVKYTPDRGGTITVSCEAIGDVVVARVADTGPGIPVERFESIFEPFVQLTAGLTERRGGVGLGLPISRDLARAMKGDLTVESTLGVGSCFTLSLPRERRSRPEARPSDLGAVRPGEGLPAAIASPSRSSGAGPPPR
jgi:signal transduction histidine kinase